MTRRFDRVFCFSGADWPREQLAYCSNTVNARIIPPSTTQRGSNMNQRILSYGLKLNDYDTATYVTGPDGRVIADTGIARICKTADQANMVTLANIDMAKRIAACLNACDGMDTEALEAMPAGFEMLLSDAFMHALKLPAVAVMISDEQARDFIEKWNNMPLNGPTIVQMQDVGDLIPLIEVDMLSWLTKVHTLHRKVEILYVVDGYTVTVTWDDHPISPDFHGESVSDAISKAMAGFDLNVRHPFQDRENLSSLERQFKVLEAQRAELLDAFEDVLNVPGLADKLDSRALQVARAAIKKAKGETA